MDTLDAMVMLQDLGHADHWPNRKGNQKKPPSTAGLKHAASTGANKSPEDGRGANSLVQGQPTRNERDIDTLLACLRLQAKYALCHRISVPRKVRPLLARPLPLVESLSGPETSPYGDKHYDLAANNSGYFRSVWR